VAPQIQLMELGSAVSSPHRGRTTFATADTLPRLCWLQMHFWCI